MDLDVQIADYIRANPPRCVRGFKLAPVDLTDLLDRDFETSYALACQCGADRGRILGYPLRDHNPDYAGPEFLSPLSFQCGVCAATTQIIDTDLHGYHAEMERREGGVASVKLRGVGSPHQYRCVACTRGEFTVVVAFIYWDFDVMMDEPDLPGEDFFNVFRILAKCTGCGHESFPADFGKL